MLASQISGRCGARGTCPPVPPPTPHHTHTHTHTPRPYNSTLCPSINRSKNLHPELNGIGQCLPIFLRLYREWLWRISSSSCSSSPMNGRSSSHLVSFRANLLHSSAAQGTFKSSLFSARAFSRLSNEGTRNEAIMPWFWGRGTPRLYCTLCRKLKGVGLRKLPLIKSNLPGPVLFYYQCALLKQNSAPCQVG